MPVIQLERVTDALVIKSRYTPEYRKQRDIE